MEYDTTREPAKSKPAQKKKLSDAEAQGVLKEARGRWDRAYEKERDNIKAAYEDLEFLAGQQWDDDSTKRRKGRPCLTVNQLPQFVHQVTGDIRKMRPAIKVVPVDSQADEKVAEIKGGLIRYIENRSDAEGVYFQAADQQVPAGIGHWRVLTEYADDSTFDQEIRIASVDDGIAVLWDPDAKRLTREDAKFCFVPVDFSKDGFKEAYPDASTEDFATLSEWQNLSGWYAGDVVRVCEYWVKKPQKRTLAITQDGKIIDLTDGDNEPPPGARIERRDSYKICRYLITACEVLEGPEEWPGRYIPIVPIIGEEVRIARKVVRNGIVRYAKDPQRMYNYFRSSQTEVVALQPKAPFLVTEENVAKYQDVWETANDTNWPYLPYTPDSQNGGASPQRVQPPVSSQGINEGVTLSNEDLRRVIGIYDASLGAKSNEISGKAILARQSEGDTGTYVYIDNFARAVRHTGKILVDLIPHIYDTERTIRIMGDDGKIDLLQINQIQMQADPETGDLVEQTLNDVTVGSYDVVAKVGPAYSTRREEAKEGMTALLQAAPDIAPVILDLVAKAQDWPMADEIAKRIRATMPPKILQMEEMEKQGVDPAQIQQMMQQQDQPPPDPAVMKMQMEAENNAARLQLDQQSAASNAEQAQAKMVMEQQAAEANRQIELAKLEESARQADAKLQAEIMIEREKIASQERIALREAEMEAECKMHDMNTKAATAYMSTNGEKENGNGKSGDGGRNDALAAGLQAIAAAMSKTKKVVRDGNGKAIGIE